MHIFEKFRRGRADDLDNLLQLLADSTIDILKEEDFRQLCSGFSTGYSRLDNMIYECLGMSGDDVLTIFREYDASSVN